MNGLLLSLVHEICRSDPDCDWHQVLKSLWTVKVILVISGITNLGKWRHVH